MKVFSGWRAAPAILGLLATPAALRAEEAIATDSGTTAWMLTSTALVLLMVPGLALFYGGLVRTKNVLGTMMHSFAAMAIITVLWTVCGYGMAFGENVLGGWFGWNAKFFCLSGIDEAIYGAAPTAIPEYVFAMFQGKFAIITPALIAGAFAERVRFRGYCIFIALWGLLVYNPLCHWVWGPGGFLLGLKGVGAIDFAGGTVVHISSGVSGLVAALFLGARRGHPHSSIRPNNMTMTLLGAGLLWVGWFGFNAGSAVASNLATAQALTVTQIAAATGAVVWMIVEGFHQGKATALGFASGVLAGLVAITPAAGVVQPTGAMALGTAAAIICYCAILLKDRIGYDDSLDAFGIHGVGGVTGALLLAFFMRPSALASRAATVEGWSAMSQFGVQLFAVVIAIAYAAAVTIVLLFVVEKVVGLRIKDQEEMAGLDTSQHGEQGYGLLNPD